MTEADFDCTLDVANAQLSKECRSCGCTKSLDQFYASQKCKLGVRPDCIDCINDKRRAKYAEDPSMREKRRDEYLKDPEGAREAAKHWRLENLDRARANGKAWREKDPFKRKETLAKWRDENPDKIAEYSKQYYRENRDEIREKKRVFRELNPEHVRERDKKYDRTGIDARRRATPKGRLSFVMQSGIRRGILGGSKAGRRTFDLLGYSVDDLKSHIESLFQIGMTWENYGDWHIDHIIPLSVFNYETPDHIDFMRCWALSNLQPLWAKDNLRKNARLDAPFQPSLAF